MGEGEEGEGEPTAGGEGRADEEVEVGEGVPPETELLIVLLV